jgi:hypothetical protein
MKAKARANKEQVKARVAALVRIVLDGAMSLDIEEYVREKERDPESVWFVPEGETPLGYSQVRRYSAASSGRRRRSEPK